MLFRSLILSNTIVVVVKLLILMDINKDSVANWDQELISLSSLGQCLKKKLFVVEPSSTTADSSVV